MLTDDREVTEEWKHHFDTHLNGVQAKVQDSEINDVVGAEEDEYVPPPTIGGVRDVINQL